MECLAGFIPANAIQGPPPFCSSKTVRVFGLNARLNATQHKEDDPLFDSAITNASLRFHHSNSPDPLFVDPYAACFLPPNIDLNVKQHLNHYCLATKFIDDKLLGVTTKIEGVKQVVLLTDGMDTRPFRLNWPNSTIIFDVSPDRIFNMAAQKLEDVGAKISRSCLFYHVSLDSYDMQQTMRNKGFTGNRPSIWVFQGLPVINLAKFKEILYLVSSLATKGCLLLGELPVWLAESEIGRSTTKEWLDNLFMSYGFQVNMVAYDEVARAFNKDLSLGEYESLLFVAEHLRFSDDQMEIWRREFQRLEEEADEEGFEEL